MPLLKFLPHCFKPITATRNQDEAACLRRELPRKLCPEPGGSACDKGAAPCNAKSAHQRQLCQD